MKVWTSQELPYRDTICSYNLDINTMLYTLKVRKVLDASQSCWAGNGRTAGQLLFGLAISSLEGQENLLPHLYTLSLIFSVTKTLLPYAQVVLCTISPANVKWGNDWRWGEPEMDNRKRGDPHNAMSLILTGAFGALSFGDPTFNQEICIDNYQVHS